MNKALVMIGGIGLGAGLMYALDPDRGKRRRAMLRDKVDRAINKIEDAIQTTSRDIRNRAYGIAAGAKALFQKEDASDEALVARVRSKLGRVVSHPHSIEVTADRGTITLSGPILEIEVEPLMDCVSSVAGVNDVMNNLEPHKEAGDVPGLQGGVRRPGERFEFMQSNWSPAARFLAGAVGGALTLFGLKRRGVLGTTASTLGLGLLARGVTNTEMKHLLPGTKRNTTLRSQGVALP
ncbi:MAG TPA: BON domain-containing protein [Blastocatellia bacterium]|nr:BON domain-containing protein [Blastocatellia bacterium]